MNATKILQSVGLKPSDSVFSISNEEAMGKILEFIKEWELRIKIKKSAKRIGKLFLLVMPMQLLIITPITTIKSGRYF